MVDTTTGHEVLAAVLQVRGGSLQVLLWERALEPHAHRWSLPGGRLLVCEFSRPRFRPFRGLFYWGMKSVAPTIAKVVSSNPEAYRYLGESIKDWHSQLALAELVEQAGWTEVEWMNLTLGVVVNRVRPRSYEHQFRIQELREHFGSLVPAGTPSRCTHVTGRSCSSAAFSTSMKAWISASVRTRFSASTAAADMI
ncbi:class I SAM-dependent methyltransferase [Kibdelosporangium lantanae]|uniref:Class I SAM-dependent methyltransferase n=1 Tax=Kibdelosporangium lantanae TaxID=1497396 RepID=A0ABW3MFQ2_9PSEU